LFSDLVVATVLALILLFLSWLSGRATGRGKPLNRFKRRLLTFSFIFVLGMGYMMALVSDLKWSRTLLFPAIVCWGLVVAAVAWYCSRREKPESGAS
jgi:uncharacterized membrane protein